MGLGKFLIAPLCVTRRRTISRLRFYTEATKPRATLSNTFYYLVVKPF